MSKNDTVSERGTHGGSETDADIDTGTDTDTDAAGESGDGTETVDLGIGISVDIDLEDVDEETEHVELSFDEDEVLESDTEESDGSVESNGKGDGARLGRHEIGPAERSALEDADVDPDAVRAKERSYRMLLDAGIEESIADELRRRFSLPWSFDGDGDGDLERRSSEVRGLGDAEREWIAVSDDEDWQSFEYEHSPVAAVERERPDERPYPKPTPVTAVTGVGPDDADRLAEAGVLSAERLATISAFEVANAVGLDVLHVRTWRHNARELLTS